MDMDAIEFFDYAAHCEGSEILQAYTRPCCDQLLFSEAESSSAKVFGATFLNIRPLLTFLVRAETMLSRSKSTLKSSLARAIISVTP